MPTWDDLQDQIRRHPRIVNATLAGLVFSLTLLMPNSNEQRYGGEPDLPAIVLAAVGSAALLLRRSMPVPVWLVTVLVGAVGVLVSGGPPVSVVPSFVALYVLAARRSLPVTAVAALATAAAPLAASAIADRWFGDLTYGVIGWSGMAAAIGAVVKSQRAVLAAAEDRAVRAERTRDEEAQRRVAEERIRIARDLHDVVAHHISVINVQAGVARHLMDDDPARARASITLVREASKTVLSELSTILGLLRTTEQRTDTHPAPSLSQAGELVDSMKHAGVRVLWQVAGQPAALPPLIDLTAYRIVQESLTNVAKHGAGEAEVSIEYPPALVRITVSNSVPASTLIDTQPAPPAGLGVIGMIERASSVGGRIQVGPTLGRTFSVVAELPLELP